VRSFLQTLGGGGGGGRGEGVVPTRVYLRPFIFTETQEFRVDWDIHRQWIIVGTSVFKSQEAAKNSQSHCHLEEGSESQCDLWLRIVWRCTALVSNLIFEIFVL